MHHPSAHRGPATGIALALLLCLGAVPALAKLTPAATPTATASARITLIIPPRLTSRTTADSLCLEAGQRTPVRLLTASGALAGRAVAGRHSPCLALASLDRPAAGMLIISPE